MATPTISSVTTYGSGANASEHAIPLVSSNASDLLFFIATNDGDSTQTTPAGWARISNGAASTLLRGCCYIRTSTATEGSVVTLGLSASEGVAAISGRITNFYGDNSGVTAGTAIAFLAATTNPPQSQSTWGEGDLNLFIAVSHFDGETSLVNSFPDLYTGSQTTANSNQGNGVAIAMASYATSVATMDPSFFTWGGSARNVGAHFVVRGSSAAAYFPPSSKIHPSSILLTGKLGG